MRANMRLGFLLAVVSFVGIAATVAIGQDQPRLPVGEVRGIQAPFGHEVVATATGHWTIPSRSGKLRELIVQDVNLEDEIQKLVQQYAEADEDEARAKARQAVRDQLDRQFTVRQEQRILEIAETDGRIRRTREMLRKRAAAKDQIVDIQLNELVGGLEGLGWGEVLGGATRVMTARQQQHQMLWQQRVAQQQVFQQPFAGGQGGQQPFVQFQLGQFQPAQVPGQQQQQQMAQQVQEAVQAFASAEEGDARTRAKQAVRDLVDQQFSGRQESQMRELVDLEGRVKRQREILQKRLNAKEQLVDMRVRKLLNEVDDLGWNPPGE